MVGTFDIENFAFFETTGAMSTQRNLIPEFPDGVIGVCKEVIKPTQYDTEEGPRLAFALVWALDDERAREVTGLPQPTIRQTLWLDVTPQGGLDMGKGKNVDLGMTREACGLNDPDKPFKPAMFVGQVAKLIIKHKTAKKTGDINANVTKVYARTWTPKNK